VAIFAASKRSTAKQRYFNALNIGYLYTFYYILKIDGMHRASKILLNSIALIQRFFKK